MNSALLDITVKKYVKKNSYRMTKKAVGCAKINSEVQNSEHDLLAIITECAYRAKMFIFNTIGI